MPGWHTEAAKGASISRVRRRGLTPFCHHVPAATALPWRARSACDRAFLQAGAGPIPGPLDAVSAITDIQCIRFRGRISDNEEAGP